MAAIPQPSAVTPSATALYVATDLRFWETDQPAAFAAEVQVNETCYRRLDPEYFAWLRDKMKLAKAAAEAGRLDAAGFEDLRTRFNAVQEWALRSFGERELLRAMRASRAAQYRPPVAEEDRVSTVVRNQARRRAVAIAAVDQICEQALALGWTMDGLYFCDGYDRRPFAARYGVVCYIGARNRIGTVASQWIEIIGPPPSENRTRFYNPEVEQPWVKRILPP